MIKIKRVYEAPSPDDGTRVLVERLWPRGVSKEEAKVDHWCREIAPSTELRKWFSHDPSKWEEFKERYSREVDKGLLDRPASLSKRGNLTLVFAARDVERNSAAVLLELLQNEGGAEGR
ncbi:MAG TPA: DUF488 domain-containing protein [Methanomassiliicoccaceae archaeon]|nr:DUF488 domain-containing protein [Methanomassiliicoccaceae archaeon]HPT73898.1 DUF488 domain-containing protein [Methanomassiliicoccaceae archaeon]HQA20242.1 DUF488 domain-containing protein [Methanomassiliicoccaceae archaeon]HQD87270.1 DUF488 domain-containing protein [Methanomassiliicoccaceae archaeon]